MTSFNHDPQAGSASANEFLLNRSWQEFNRMYPSEEACVEELYRRLSKDFNKCRHCRSPDVKRPYGTRSTRCGRCHKKSWFTAGTFFNRIRSVRPWLAAIWLIERGVSICSYRLHQLVGVAYSSALTIFKKLMIVVQSSMGEKGLTVPSSYFKLLFCKRSRETPAREHPNAEQDEIDVEYVDRDMVPDAQGAKDSSKTGEGKAARQTAIDLPESEAALLELMSEVPMHFDKLCEHTGQQPGELSAALTMLELDGFIERKPGERYVRLPQSPASEARSLGKDCTVSPSIEAMAEEALEFIRNTFHGISRKCISFYLAAYWCHSDRIWCSPGALLEQCIESAPITYTDILLYVSPPVLKLAQPKL